VEAKGRLNFLLAVAVKKRKEIAPKRLIQTAFLARDICFPSRGNL